MLKSLFDGGGFVHVLIYASLGVAHVAIQVPALFMGETFPILYSLCPCGRLIDCVFVGVFPGSLFYQSLFDFLTVF